MHPKIKQTNLFKILEKNTELISCLASTRKKVEAIAASISRSVPSFTDHSIRHMDAMWEIADIIITEDEYSKLTVGEGFILAMSFYLHDIGMALASSEDGLEAIFQSKPYKSFMLRTPENQRDDNGSVSAGINYAVRQLHADAAIDYSINKISNDEYIIESKDIRDQWGSMIGKIAASHNWSLSKIKTEIGDIGERPLPISSGDLTYVAILLRIIDFAHINRDRALALERIYRGTLQEESVIHWLAQENIDGPTRQNDLLCYASSKEIESIDAWWLYYETLKGLDQEIKTSKQFLDGIITSRGRLSLQGVKGVDSQDEISKYIKPKGFLPLEISIKTKSIEKLVKLLAGESLYGTDYMAPVRELLQNARDAIFLYSCLAKSEPEKALATIPIKISLTTDTEAPTFTIEDWGVGMDLQIITDYLLTLASSYWDDKFYSDFPDISKDFCPAGKFGIGFLSVFMLGDKISLSTQRIGCTRYLLQLNGVARRGAIQADTIQNGNGTRISISLKKNIASKISNIYEKIKAYAPLIGHTISVTENGETKEIEKDWMSRLNAIDFYKWVFAAIKLISSNTNRLLYNNGCSYYQRRYFEDEPPIEWPLIIPECKFQSTRLVCSGIGVSILCSKGLSIRPVSTPGFTGVINEDDIEVDTSRSNVLRFDVKKILDQAKSIVKDDVSKNLEHLNKTSFLVENMEFICKCVEIYGNGCLTNSSLRWINLLKIPGDVELVSTQTFKEQVSKQCSIFVCCGTGPWTAMKKWNTQCKNHQNELAIVIDDTKSSIDYLLSESQETGKLKEIWSSVEDEPLFMIILEILCDTWGTDKNHFFEQDNWSHKSDVVWGYLKKSQL